MRRVPVLLAEGRSLSESLSKEGAESMLGRGALEMAGNFSQTAMEMECVGTLAHI